MSTYVVLDLEMCNVPRASQKQYGWKQEIIQIGAVLLDAELRVVSKFNSYVQPQYGILDSFIKGFTGISWKGLSNAPKLNDALAAFIHWLPDENVTIVTWSNSDKKQLLNEMRGKAITSPAIEECFEEWLDCQPMFAEKMGNRRCYTLSEALVAADIATEGREHNGLSDAYNTALLFSKMMNNDEWKLNTYYQQARSTDEPQALCYSMSDLFAGIDLSGLAIA